MRCSKIQRIKGRKKNDKDCNIEGTCCYTFFYNYAGAIVSIMKIYEKLIITKRCFMMNYKINISTNDFDRKDKSIVVQRSQQIFFPVPIIEPFFFFNRALILIVPGERPYKCHLPECGRAFIQLSNLQQHLRNHDAQVERAKNRPFHCNICGKGFATESSLRTHTSKVSHVCTRNKKSDVQQISHFFLTISITLFLFSILCQEKK